MKDQADPKLWKDFFALETVGELRKFSDRLNNLVPEQAALQHYISTWPDFIQGVDDGAFCPGNHVSIDRSAVMFGNMPVIFEGTNRWSWKAHYLTDELIAQAKALMNSITALRESNPDTRITFLLVPEKDYFISQFLLKEDRFIALNAAISKLRSRLEELDIALIYEQPFHGIDKFQSVSDFEYKDSHLAGRNYISAFRVHLADLGIPWSSVQPSVTLTKMPQFGDLAKKFEEQIPMPVLVPQPDFPQSAVVQTAGSKSFADPLGDTWQEFSNEKPLVDQSICVLGDSHCSIYEQRKITYLIANTFRETHFEWNPCGIRKKPDIAPYDSVLLEISSRFVF